MTPLQGQAFERDIAELEAAEAQRPKPPQRYMLMKYVGGEAVPVHRLFVDGEPEDQVEAIDNDFLNFSTTVIRLTASVVLQGGVAVVKGDYPLSYCEDTVIPNLQVLHSNESQKNFEKRMMKLKMTPWGNVDETPLRVQPNSTWHAGYFGGVVDAGEFKPLSKKDGDVIPIAYVGRKPEE